MIIRAYWGKGFFIVGPTAIIAGPFRDRRAAERFRAKHTTRTWDQHRNQWLVATEYPQ